MKKLIYFLALSLPFTSQSQALLHGKNILKTNLSSIPLKNYSFTYERLVYNKMSVAVSYRFMPKGNLPLENSIKDFIDNPSVNVGRLQMGNWAITPEVRFYAHKRMRGFYMAPYARIANFDVTVPMQYTTSPSRGESQKVDADFTGTIKSFSGGFMLGVQQQIFKRIVVDVWIIGAHYGSSTGDLTASYAKNPLQPDEVQSLQSAIDLVDASPFRVQGTAGTISSVLHTDGPWAGVRGAGINIGFRF